MIGYRFHPEAEIDLDEIWESIAAENINAADRVSAAIRQALDNLVTFPQRGHRRTDLTSRPLRFIRVRDYLIASAPDEKPLWVIAVMHGHRAPVSWPRSCGAGSRNRDHRCRLRYRDRSCVNLPETAALTALTREQQE